MYGPIEKFAHHLGLHSDHIKKKKKKKKTRPKREVGEGSTYRDYRGIEGVLEDAQKGKKK